MSEWITEGVAHGIIRQLQDLLFANLGDLNEAFLQDEDGLDVSFKLRLKSVEGGVESKPSIGFVKSRVKEVGRVVVFDPNQTKLPFEEPYP